MVNVGVQPLGAHSRIESSRGIVFHSWIRSILKKGGRLADSQINAIADDGKRLLGDGRCIPTFLH